jgi:hypothetical protein
MWILFVIIPPAIFALGWYLGAREERKYGRAAAQLQMQKEMAEEALEEENDQQFKQWIGRYKDQAIDRWLNKEIQSMRLEKYNV